MLKQLRYPRRESLELGDPVRNSGERPADEEGPGHVPLHQERNGCDALDGFTQTHLISQNAVHPVLIQQLKQKTCYQKLTRIRSLSVKAPTVT